MWSDIKELKKKWDEDGWNVIKKVEWKFFEIEKNWIYFNLKMKD